MDKNKVINEVRRIIHKHKSACLVWSESPSGVIRSQIDNHFDNAERNIQELLKKHWPELQTPE